MTCSAYRERVACRARQFDPHGLRFGELTNRIEAALAADPARTEAAERRVRRDDAIGRDPDGARATRSSHPMSAAHVERADSGGEAVHAFVGERDRFVFI